MIKLGDKIQIRCHGELGTCSKEVHAFVQHERFDYGILLSTSISYLVPVGPPPDKSLPSGSFFWRNNILEGWDEAEKKDHSDKREAKTVRTFTYDKLLVEGDLYIWIEECYMIQSLEQTIEQIKKETSA